MLKRQDNMSKLKYMQIDLSLINHVTVKYKSTLEGRIAMS